MLYLLVQSGPDYFAIEALHIVEVIPLVCIEPLAGTPPSQAGFIRYHDTAVAVHDLTKLLAPGQRPPSARMSTRIVMLRHPAHPDPLGLRVDKVAYTLPADPSNFKPVGLGLDHQGFVTGIWMNGPKIIHALDVVRLLEHLASNPSARNRAARPLWITPESKSF